jgi:hypothetical protein
MNTGTKRQAVRLASLAVASGVLVAAGTGAAGATTQKTTLKHKVQGAAQTDVVQVSLNVPLGSDLATLLPQLGQGIDLAKPITANLIHTEGQLVRNQITGAVDAATSVSKLASGTLFDNGGLLSSVNRSVTASLAKPGSYANTDGLAKTVGPISVSIPTLRASAVKHLLSTAGKGQLAGLSVADLKSLLKGADLAALNEALAKVIGTPGDTEGSAVGTIVKTVDSLLTKIDSTLQATPVGSAAHTALAALQKVIKGLQDALPRLVATLQNGSIVDLKALDSSHSIATTVGNTVTSKAGVTLAHLSLLGGFVSLDGFDNSVVARATGKAGGASYIANPNVAKVHVGSPVGLDLVLGPNGLAASLLGSALPAQVISLVNTLVKSIENILSLAGVKISAAQISHKFNSDKSAVTVASSGLQVLVNSPLNRTNKDIRKALVGVTVGAASATAGSFTAASVTKPTPVVTPKTPKGDLPHTGANLPVTAGAALVFLIGAAVLRRRMSSAA